MMRQLGSVGPVLLRCASAGLFAIGSVTFISAFAQAQGACFPPYQFNMNCRQPQNAFSHPTFGAITKRQAINSNWIAWDQNIASTNDEFAWENHSQPDWAPEHRDAAQNWDDASTHLNVYERGSCSSAGATGDGVICTGMWNWCKFIDRVGSFLTAAETRTAPGEAACPDGAPTDMKCFKTAKIIWNGGWNWQSGMCGVGTETFNGRVPVPEEIASGGTCNKRFPRRRSDGQRITFGHGIKAITLHEMGHGFGLTDLSGMCLPSGSIMHQLSLTFIDPVGDESPCTVTSACSSIKVWDSDQKAIWYLYDGP